jgi:hypothetical protein
MLSAFGAFVDEILQIGVFDPPVFADFDRFQSTALDVVVERALRDFQNVGDIFDGIQFEIVHGIHLFLSALGQRCRL